MKTPLFARARITRHSTFWCAEHGLTATEHVAVVSVVIVAALAAYRVLGGAFVETADQARDRLSFGAQSPSSAEVARADAARRVNEPRCVDALNKRNRAMDNYALAEQALLYAPLTPEELEELRRKKDEFANEVEQAESLIDRVCRLS